MTCPKRHTTACFHALLALVLLAPQLPAQSASPSLDGLLTAIADRVDDLGVMTFPSKAQKKERKQLTKAYAKLEDYAGDNEPADLARLRKTTRAVLRSKTGDAAVLDQLDAVRDTLDGVAGFVRAEVVILLPQLMTLTAAKPLKGAQKSLDKGDARRNAALGLWPVNKPKAVASMLKAIAIYRAREKKARKSLTKRSENDLMIADFSVLTVDAQIGHPLDLGLVLEASSNTPQVTVTFSAIRQEDLDQSSEDPVQYVLGELVQTDVPAGSHDHLLSVLIPPEVAPDDYYIVAHIDPHGKIYESDEDNNVFFDAANLRGLSDAWLNVPNLVVESFDFDPAIIAVVVSDLEDDVVGANVRVSLTGQQPLTNVPLGFAVSLENDRLCIPVNGSDTCLDLPEVLPVPVWNSATGEYADYYVIPEIAPGEPLDIHLDFRWSWDEAAEFAPDLLPLLDQMDESSSSNNLLDLVVATIDPTDILEEYEPLGDDNSAATTGILQLYKLADCDLEKSYDKTWASGIVGVGVELVGGLDLSADGAEASVTGALPVWLFSSTPFELFDFQCLATREPVTHYSALELDVDFAGLTIYAVSFDTDTPLLEDGFTWEEDGFSYESEGSDGTARWFVSKEWPEDAKKASKTFFVAGFPVTVSTKLEGQVGFEAVVTNTDTFSFGVGPFAALGLDLNAKTCAGPFCVGAGGEIILIEDTFLTTAGTTMTVVEGVDTQGADATSIDASLDFDVTNTIKALHGRLYVFAEYPWCDVCWAVFIPYPCHCGQKHSELTIVSWEAFTWAQPLIVKSCATCIPVVGLPVCP